MEQEQEQIPFGNDNKRAMAFYLLPAVEVRKKEE